MSYQRFDLTTGATAPGALRLAFARSSRLDQKPEALPHSQPCLELLFCVHGIGQLILNDKVYPLGSDDLVLINPNILHNESSFPSNPLECIVLGIEGVSFEVGSRVEPFVLHNFRNARDEILFYLNTLLRELSQREDSYMLVCQHLLSALLVRILRGVDISFLLLPNHRTNKGCVAVRRYIEEHYAEPISLDTLSNHTHLDKYYLVHVFSKEYGTTPINYLIECRVRESKRLLSTTDHPLSSIAQMMGFSSPSYFSQSFRRQEGISPTEYRKRSRAGLP